MQGLIKGKQSLRPISQDNQWNVLLLTTYYQTKVCSILNYAFSVINEVVRGSLWPNKGS